MLRLRSARSRSKRACCRLPATGERLRNLLLGLIVGVGLCVIAVLWSRIVGPQLKSTRVTRPSSSLPPAQRPDWPPVVTSDVPRGARAGVRQTLYVGVLTLQKYAATRAAACSATWGKSSLIAGIEFFAQLGAEPPPEPAPHITNLTDVDSTDYAHQQKSFAMLEHICTRHVHQYDWFVRAVDDVYIDVPRLRALLSRYDPRRAVYVGHPAKAVDDVSFAALGSSAYCLGGAPIVFSQKLMEDLCEYLPTCRNKFHYADADVEIARCIKTYTGLDCATSGLLSRDFFNSYERNQFHVLETYAYKKHIISLHPVKSTWLMKTLHRLHLAKTVSRLSDRLRSLLRSEQRLLTSSNHRRTPTVTSSQVPSSPETSPPVNRSHESTFVFDANGTIVYTSDTCALNTQRSNIQISEIHYAVRFANASCRLGDFLHCPKLIGGYTRIADSGATYVVDLSCSRQGDANEQRLVRVTLTRSATWFRVKKRRRRLVRKPLVIFAQSDFSELPSMIDFLLHVRSAIRNSTGRYALYMLLTSHESSSTEDDASQETSDLVGDMTAWYGSRGLDVRAFVTSQSDDEAARVTQSVLRELDQRYDDSVVLMTSPELRFTGAFLRRCRAMARRGKHAYRPYASEHRRADGPPTAAPPGDQFANFWTERASPMCAHISDVYELYTNVRKRATFRKSRKPIKVTRAFDLGLEFNSF